MKDKNEGVDDMHILLKIDDTISKFKYHLLAAVVLI